MTNTAPTTGAADLPEALRVPLDSLHADAGYLCGRLLNGSLTQEQVVESIHRRIDAAKLAALAAGQATAAQQGVAYAALPTSSYAGRVYEEGFLIGTCPLYTADKLRAFADATCALRASRWQAPSGATEEVENLRKALVYAAFALHDAPQYMLAQGIALIDGDTVRVSRDGWTVEASVNPHRQPAPAPPPECETEAEKRAFAFGWFKALESERMKAESVQEDAAQRKSHAD